MNKDFPLNRFNFTNLIEHIRTEILIPNVITDDETGIEFYGGDSIPQKALIDLLKNFNIIDNLVQQSNCLRLKEIWRMSRHIILTGRSKTVLWKQSLSSYGTADSLLALK